MIVFWRLILCCGVSLLTAVIVECRLNAAVLMPHGDFAYDPNLIPFPERDSATEERENEWRAAHAIAQASRRAGQWLTHDVQPDVLLVLTPHGVHAGHDFGVYLGSDRAAGSARMGQDVIRDKDDSLLPREYDVTLEGVSVDQARSQDLLQYLQHQKAHANVSGLYLAPGGQQPLPLHWGEVIPLLLMPLGRNRTHIFWSFPHRRHNHAATDMVDELLHMGAAIRTWINAQEAKFAVVVSGDLSHTHRADGPYGYSNASQHLDEALGEWAGNGTEEHHDPCGPRRTRALLEKAKHWQPKGLSCGFSGYVMWHGMLCGADTSVSNDTNSETWHSRVLVNYNVTYYGMMVAQYWKEHEHGNSIHHGDTTQKQNASTTSLTRSRELNNNHTSTGFGLFSPFRKPFLKSKD